MSCLVSLAYGTLNCGTIIFTIMTNVTTRGHENNMRYTLMPHIKETAILHERLTLLHACFLVFPVNNFVILARWKISRCLASSSMWHCWLRQAKNVGIVFYELNSILHDVKGICIVSFSTFGAMFTGAGSSFRYVLLKRA